MSSLHQWVCRNSDSWYAWNMFPTLPYHWNSVRVRLWCSRNVMDHIELAVYRFPRSESDWLVFLTRKSNLALEKRKFRHIHVNNWNLELSLYEYACFIFVNSTVKPKQQPQLNGSGVDSAMQTMQFKPSKMNWNRPVADRVASANCLMSEPTEKASLFASCWCSSNSFRVSMLWFSSHSPFSRQPAPLGHQQFAHLSLELYKF